MKEIIQYLFFFTIVDLVLEDFFFIGTFQSWKRVKCLMLHIE